MKILITALLALTIALSFTSCKKELFNSTGEFDVCFGQPVKVQIGDEIMEINFTKLVEESRCPPKMVCFWAGQVAVEIRVNDETDLQLGAHTTLPAVVKYKTHSIKFVSATFDKDANYSNEKNYTLRLKVD